MTTAMAVASRFRAVPPMVWSAFRLMEAKASSRLYTIPASAATRTEISTTRNGDMSAGSMVRVRTPATPPMTMMPSSAMLMMPECSLNIPPSATSIRTMPYSRVYLIKSSILLALLLRVGLFRRGQALRSHWSCPHS